MIGLPHQPAGTESPKPPSSAVTMEPREGRIGNAFACERCRKHKVRCVPSEAAGICQRCQKARVECIEHVARRRPAKHRTAGQTPNRVAEIEKSLDKLSALVTATSAPSSAPPPALPPITKATAQITELTQRTPTTTSPVASVLPPSVSKNPILPAPRSSPDSAISFWESINETISGLGRLDPVIRSISIAHMQMLLDTYRAMADFFPFVTLPKDSSYAELIQQRPMLMFAVLSVASSESVQLQLTLSREFRKVIMIKIMHGEKSLDLLQALLVFIAWHHHYMDSQAVSVHMLLQMCVGIAGDLGLDSISTDARSPLQKEESRNREAKRAYLGCYYLVSNIGLMESGKPRSMSYSSTLRSYAADLASTWEHPSDAILPILIDTCQFMEDVEETLRNQSEQALVARSQLKRLGDKWDHLRLASKLQANDFKTLQWIQLAARTYLYNVASSLDLPDRESTPWASGFQLSMRITCLRSIEQFLDNSMKLSATQYGFLSVVDWLNLISTLTTLSKLALHTSHMPGWDPAELQLAKTFEYFRDQLSSQMPRPRESQEKNEDAYERFRRITNVMKLALKTAPGRASPNGSTFEISTGSGRTISLLQELPLPRPNGMLNGVEKLPTPWKVTSQLDVGSTDFPWKFLMGTV